MARGLDDQGPHPQWSRAVLHHPGCRGVDPSPRKGFSTLSEPTCVAIYRHAFPPVLTSHWTSGAVSSPSACRCTPPSKSECMRTDGLVSSTYRTAEDLTLGGK